MKKIPLKIQLNTDAIIIYFVAGKGCVRRKYNGKVWHF
jgi:hypothetical protein